MNKCYPRVLLLLMLRGDITDSDIPSRPQGYIAVLARSLRRKTFFFNNLVRWDALPGGLVSSVPTYSAIEELIPVDTDVDNSALQHRSLQLLPRRRRVWRYE